MNRKKKLRFNSILLAVILSFIFVSCDSSDDTLDVGVSIEGTKIRIEIPGQGNLDNYNWNDAKIVWSQEFEDNYSFKKNWFFENILVSDQLQLYTNENVEISNGPLKIYARKVVQVKTKGIIPLQG